MPVRYEERSPLRLSVAALLGYAVLLLVTFVPAVRDGGLRTSHLVLVPALFLPFLPFLPVVVLPLSKRRYSAISVTEDELLVGRDRLPLAGVSVVEPHPQARLLGGAYAAPAGWRLVGLQGPDGRVWTVATKQPAKFIQVLQDRS